MELFSNLRAVVLAVLAAFSFQAVAADPAATERLKRYKEQKDAIYERMKHYGISREDILALRRLSETAPPYSKPHVSIAAEKVLDPGEHFRIEMDEFMVTMMIPDAPPVPGN